MQTYFRDAITGTTSDVVFGCKTICVFNLRKNYNCTIHFNTNYIHDVTPLSYIVFQFMLYRCVSGTVSVLFNLLILVDANKTEHYAYNASIVKQSIIKAKYYI